MPGRFSGSWKNAPLTPEEFSSYPQARRLAIVAGRYPPSGEAIARWIAFEMSTESPKTEAAAEVVDEYARNPHAIPTGEYSEYEGDMAAWAARQLRALWTLVPSVAASDCLSTSTAPSRPRRSLPVVPEVLESLTGGLLTRFLLRADVDLREFRKSVFFSIGERYSELNKSAAVSHNFGLTDEEFRGLLRSRPNR